MEAQKQPAASTVRELVDSRRQPRFKLEIDICIHSRTCGALKGNAVDLSESGISALLRIEVPVGEVVDLEFTLPLGEVRVLAIVRQKNAFRYGFEFLGLNGGNEVIRATCRDLAVEQDRSDHSRD